MFLIFSWFRLVNTILPSGKGEGSCVAFYNACTLVEVDHSDHFKALHCLTLWSISVSGCDGSHDLTSVRYKAQGSIFPSCHDVRPL